jgi:hypothetical protein
MGRSENLLLYMSPARALSFVFLAKVRWTQGKALVSEVHEGMERGLLECAAEKRI